MAYSKRKLKSNGDKTSLFVVHSGLENYQTNIYLYGLYVLFKHILISLTSFMGIPESMRILYNISLLTES
jgi:hypothetical protein